MSPTTHRINKTLPIAPAAVPFAFALIRAVRTGHDLRYLWVALASLLGMMAIMLLASAYGRRPGAAVAVSAVVFLVSMLFALVAAMLLGTTLGPGILVVASAFGLCYACSCLLYTLPSKV